MNRDKLNPGALAGATGARNVKAGGTDKPKDSTSPPAKERPAYLKQARWRARNPVADWAHAATRSAIRRGIITQQPCAICGAAKAEAHHPDHHDPLRVEWLCRAHHKALHATLRKLVR